MVSPVRMAAFPLIRPLRGKVPPQGEGFCALTFPFPSSPRYREGFFL